MKPSILTLAVALLAPPAALQAVETVLLPAAVAKPATNVWTEPPVVEPKYDDMSVSAQTMKFVHPGGNEAQDELDFVKAKLAQKAEPWYSQFNKLMTLAIPGGTIPALPDENGQKYQAKRAYANALAYNYTGNTLYADQAVAILKAWSNVAAYNVYDGRNLTQAMLNCAWMGSLLGPAAELVRGYMSPADRARIINMFQTKFVPSLSVMDPSNGNRDLTQIDALFNISVFCEDAALFHTAVKRMAYRIPGYIYLKSDGSNAISLPGAHWEHHDTTVFASPNSDGVMQETCRDYDHHTQFAMAAFFCAAEVAWHQGVDLYAQYQPRFIAGMELMAKQLSSGSMQGVCAQGDKTTVEVFNTFEIGYNHYHNRMGLSLPNTQEVLPKTRQGACDWNIFYETLTHGDLQLPAQKMAVLKAATPNKSAKPATNVWTEPPVVEPNYDGTPVPAPKNAVILFDGRDASGWMRTPYPTDTNQSTQFTWKVADGCMEVTTARGARQATLVGTKESPITSGHLHIEWATPAVVKGNGQGRGNSGVFIEGFPELQVLDSFSNQTYFDGQAAAFYKHRPPLVNASRGPGLWQCYDIYIQRAKVVAGKIVEPETITVYHNRVLVQDHLTFANPVQTSALQLQDHLNPVRFRNIWFAAGESAAK